MGTWIDFKKLREELDFAAVLSHYGVALKANPAGQHQGKCPLPLHPKGSTSRSFSVNLKKKVWRCFACGSHSSGNILDFAVVMEGGDPKNPVDVRRIALLLQERFGSQRPKSTASPRGASALGAGSPVATEAVNAPLDFALKNLEAEHVFFRKHDLELETVRHFELGFCTKGMCAGRIAIPLHNPDGQLIGYAGRLTDEFENPEHEPVYVWPSNRERNGMKLVFDRGKFLYQGHAIKEPVTDLVIVQRPESVWRVWQAGFVDVVGLMGDAASLEQAALIVGLVRPKGRIWLLTDGTKAGERCASELFFDLGPQRFCRWVKLPSGQPSNYSDQQLHEMLAWPSA